ncbi:MAG TPA: cytochrome P450 [Acidimicrobiales bacterium]|nr:cytochrome P450 [Acidimicrobiales bacterium]
MPDAGADTGRFDPAIFADPAHAADPQPGYKQARDAGPAVPGLFGGVQLVRKSAVDFALRHPDLFSSAMEAVDLGQTYPLIPLQVDPPEHVKYRRLLDPVFAPQRMARLEPDVIDLVNQRIDGFIHRGECDFAAEFAVPLPSLVFLRLLGVPSSDLELFLSLKDGIVRPQGSTMEEITNSQRLTAQRIDAYFRQILDDRRAARRDDLLSWLIEAEIGGDRLSEEEILGICFLLLLAGLDTVTDALECSLAYLASHPDQQRLLRDKPEVIPTAVEELLRHETPVASVGRVAARDVDVEGCPIAKGTKVGICLGAANTDERALPDAGQVDLTRAPNRHLAFGGGVHRCLGSHLARMELRVSLVEWHRRIGEYRIAPGAQLTWSPALRQVDRLPLLFEAN